MLVTIREQLQSTMSFNIGDSALDTRRQAWRDLFARMERLAALEEPWTLVIRYDTDSDRALCVPTASAYACKCKKLSFTHVRLAGMFPLS